MEKRLVAGNVHVYGSIFVNFLFPGSGSMHDLPQDNDQNHFSN